MVVMKDLSVRRRRPLNLSRVAKDRNNSRRKRKTTTGGLAPKHPIVEQQRPASQSCIGDLHSCRTLAHNNEARNLIEIL